MMLATLYIKSKTSLRPAGVSIYYTVPQFIRLHGDIFVESVKTASSLSVRTIAMLEKNTAKKCKM